MGSGSSPTASAERVRERGNAVPSSEGGGLVASHDGEADSLVLSLVDVVETVWQAVVEGTTVRVVNESGGGLSVEAGGGRLGRVPAGYVEVVRERQLFGGEVEHVGQYPQELLVRLRRTR